MHRRGLAPCDSTCCNFRTCAFVFWCRRSSAAVGVAAWVRVLLPQILGAPLPAAAQQGGPARRSMPRLGAEGADRALGFLDALLRQGRPPVEAPELDERGLLQWHPGTVGLAPADSHLARFCLLDESC